MTGRQWVESFVESLFELRSRANNKKYYNSDSRWTEFIVKEVMKEAMGKKIDYRVACWDQNDRENSGEYLNIDAMFFDNSAYESRAYLDVEEKTNYDPRVLPLVVVEHENAGSDNDKIAHCLWKLLCLRSQLRVLICYQENIDKIKKFLENTIRVGKLAEGLIGELLVIIGDSSKDDVPWEKRNDIKNYFKVFEWKNNYLEKFTE